MDNEVKTVVIRFRVSDDYRDELREACKVLGIDSLSDELRPVTDDIISKAKEHSRGK